VHNLAPLLSLVSLSFFTFYWSTQTISLHTFPAYFTPFLSPIHFTLKIEAAWSSETLDLAEMNFLGVVTGYIKTDHRYNEGIMEELGIIHTNTTRKPTKRIG
jgi:hypothetical protein